MRNAMKCCIAAFACYDPLCAWYRLRCMAVSSERIDYADGSYAIITTVYRGMTRATVDDSKIIYIL